MAKGETFSLLTMQIYREELIYGYGAIRKMVPWQLPEKTTEK